MDSYERILKSLKDILVDIIPIKNIDKSKNEIVEQRFIDNFRPTTDEEELFLDKMHRQEYDLMKSNYIIILLNFKFYLNFLKLFRI